MPKRKVDEIVSPPGMKLRSGRKKRRQKTPEQDPLEDEHEEMEETEMNGAEDVEDNESEEEHESDEEDSQEEGEEKKQSADKPANGKAVSQPEASNKATAAATAKTTSTRTAARTNATTNDEPAKASTEGKVESLRFRAEKESEEEDDDEDLPPPRRLDLASPALPAANTATADKPKTDTATEPEAPVEPNNNILHEHHEPQPSLVDRLQSLAEAAQQQMQQVLGTQIQTEQLRSALESPILWFILWMLLQVLFFPRILASTVATSNSLLAVYQTRYYGTAQSNMPAQLGLLQTRLQAHAARVRTLSHELGPLLETKERFVESHIKRMEALQTKPHRGLLGMDEADWFLQVELPQDCRPGLLREEAAAQMDAVYHEWGNTSAYLDPVQLRKEIRQYIQKRTRSSKGDMGMDDLETLVRSRLVVEAADETGKRDYALLLNGARVDYANTSPSLVDDLPLWNRMLAAWRLRFYGHGPEAAMTPTSPSDALGQCWSFSKTRSRFGDMATLTIRLATPIFVQSVSVEGRVGRPTSIRNFRVIGLDDEGRDWNLGSYLYDIKKTTRQDFAIDETIGRQDVPKVSSISLAIDDNWGASYSCLYRIRVHGQE